MSFGPKYTFENANEIKASKKFTDRKEHFEAFDQAVERTIKKDNKYNVLVFYGIGGIGKSSLRREFEKRVADKFKDKCVSGTVDFDMSNNRDVEGALFELRRHLNKNYKIKFPLFDIAYALYWQRLHPQMKMTAETFPFLEESDTLLEILSVLNGVFPAIGTIPKITKLAEQGLSAISDWWNKRGKRELYEMPDDPKEIAKRFPLYFATDFKKNTLSAGLTPIIFIDTYEALWEGKRDEGTFFSKDAWIRELIGQMENSLFVICGRERIRWEEIDKDCESILEQHLIGGLSEIDARWFLNEAGIVENEIQNTIITSSEGLPYYLDLAVDTYHEIIKNGQKKPEISDFGKTIHDMHERFMRYLRPDERETLKVLSICRFWDRKLFEQLVVKYNTMPVTAYDELCRFSFISEDENGNRFLHALMRENIQQYNMDAGLINQVHQYLYEHYNKSLEGLDLKTISRKEKIAFKEAFYHGKFTLDKDKFYEWFIAIADKFFKSYKFDVLLDLYKDATDYFEKTCGVKHTYTAMCYHNAGLIYLKQALYDAALEFLNKSLDIRLEISGEEHSDTAENYENIGNVFSNQGKYDEAFGLNEKSLKIRLKVFGEDHFSVATSYCNIGGIYSYKGEYDRALEYCEKSLQIRLKVLGQNHPDIAENYNEIGRIYFYNGKYDRALKYCEKSLNIDLEIYGAEHPNVATSYNNLGSIYSDKGEYDKALEYHEKSLEIKLKVHDEEHPKVATSYNNIGSVCTDKGEYDKALEYFEKALKIRLKVYGKEHPNVAGSYNNLGQIYSNTQEYDKALESYEKSLKILIKNYGESDIQVARQYLEIGDTYRSLNDNDNALLFHHNNLKLLIDLLGENHHSTASAYLSIGFDLEMKKEYDESLKFYHKSLDIFKSLNEEEDAHISYSYFCIGTVYAKMKNKEKAIEMFHESRVIYEKLNDDEGMKDVDEALNELE